MSIENLYRAANAAGFAMAAPDDDVLVDPRTSPVRAEDAGRAVVALTPGDAERSPLRETLTEASGWVRGLLPTLGGRAPA